MGKKSKWINMSPIIRTATKEAMLDALEFLKDESNKRVPHDEGILEASGDLMIDSDKAEGIIFYDTPYAIRLHEHPEYHFQKGREGKWLKNTFDIHGDKAIRYIQKRIKETLR